MLNLVTKVKKRLTYNGSNDYSPTWSPVRSGKPQIYTMNSSTGGGVTKITSKTYGARSPSWAH